MARRPRPTVSPSSISAANTNAVITRAVKNSPLGLYVQDQIKAGNWIFNLGMRGDLYNGLAVARQAEPRLGVAYSIKPTNTVLRLSYARTWRRRSMRILFYRARAAGAMFWLIR
jgi:outer membrane receptor protein involved in Fe transport